MYLSVLPLFYQTGYDTFSAAFANSADRPTLPNEEGQKRSLSINLHSIRQQLSMVSSCSVFLLPVAVNLDLELHYEVLCQQHWKACFLYWKPFLNCSEIFSYNALCAVQRTVCSFWSISIDASKTAHSALSNKVIKNFFFVYLDFMAHQDYFTHFENGRSPRKTTWPPASGTWLVSHVTRARS